MSEEKKQLTSLPNIGDVLAEQLILAGINNEKELKSAGTENVFIKLLTIDNESCLMKLYAIEGAIQGIRWHFLPNERVRELKDFFHSIKK